MSLVARQAAAPAPTSSAPVVTDQTPATTPPVKQTPASALDVYSGDPNFMTSLARGLIVIQAFTQQTPQMTISQLSLEDRPLPRRRPPLPLHPHQARLRRRRRRHPLRAASQAC
jgi:hypothetical protein